MQEALAEKSHLVVLLNLHDAADICSLVDAIAGLNSFEVDATLVLYKSPHASNQELISSSTLAFNSKLLVVDLCDLSSRKDIVWNLIRGDLNCQLLNVRSLWIKKLDMVGKFTQLRTLILNSCSSLVNLEEECFASMPKLRCLSLCGTRVINLGTNTTSAVFSRLSPLVELQFHNCTPKKDTWSCPALINERRCITSGKIGEPTSGRHFTKQTTGADESPQLLPSGGSFTIKEARSMFQGASVSKLDKALFSVPCHDSNRQENLKIEVSPGHLDVQEKDESPTSVLQWDSTDYKLQTSKHPLMVDFEKQNSESMIEPIPCLENMDNFPIKEADRKVEKTFFSKHYEYLPYKRQHKESIISILHMREAGTSGMYPHNHLRTKLTSSCRKSQCFYTKSLCTSKFDSSMQPLLHPITNVSQKNREEGKRLRPRQFEYHPSISSLMAVGTLDGEVVLLNPETRNIINHISSKWNSNSILGLCWLKNDPSKLLVGSDNGSLRLYDINHLPQEVEDGYCNPSTVIFEDFEHLTSVHVNSADDQFLTSGYSKKVAIYDICSGKRLQLFTDMHREPINVAKFANHSPNLMVTSSFDRDVKMWDLRQKPIKPCYTASSSRGNVMVCFSHDDLYLLVSSVDNEVRQLLAVDGTLHTKFDIVSTGSYNNYTRSYYMNGRDYIISGSCEEPVVRVCCAQTGRLLRNIYLEDDGLASSIFVQSLRSDPFRHFHLAVLAAYVRPSRHWEIINVTF
ncbi:Transducin family WD-40 repeat family isoform 1 [Olea europaea subsp. europaea]|uniref:Transducin family WD-40 repeat family isoform 1 n=1 Tax=Olea europaea subsp. europaea TaxID=158383 RepID=A0A8S0Q043_OLEEU|nr:Transducin family WD-40 repeat family isoform 1 [Olea europaea subsp. europaea]